MPTDDPLSSVRESRDSRYFWFQKYWSLLGLALFAVTWRLWTPQTVFPQIPFLEFLTRTPAAVDWIALAFTLAGLVTVLLAKQSTRVQIGMALFAFSAICLILLDQHRLQPWAYQFAICALVMTLSRGRLAMRLMGLITVGIYAYSAFSKFDFQFTETLGRDFLDSMVGFVGIDTIDLDSKLVSRLVLVLPAYELAMGLGLLLPTTRRYAVWGIVIMHLMLLLILGPLGMQHRPGVLVWNLFLLGQVIFLFGGRKENPADWIEVRSRRRGWIGDPLAMGVTLLVLLFPLSVSFGVCDHWPGWEVYAPRSSRATLEISEMESNRLPPTLKKYLSDDQHKPGFRKFELDRWSLDVLDVPIYPTDRFQFAVAIAVITNYELDDVRISIGDISNRWTGERVWRIVDKPDELKMVADQFRLGTIPRLLPR